MSRSFILPRDAMHKLGLCRCAVSVCLSVRLSRSCIQLKQLNIIFYFFSPSGSHTILVFPYQTLWQYSDGDPVMVASNAGGVWKTIFSTNILFLRVLSTVRPSSVVNKVPPDRGKLMTLIAGSIKRQRFLIAEDGRQSATHQWILFMTQSLNVTPNKTT